MSQFQAITIGCGWKRSLVPGAPKGIGAVCIKIYVAAHFSEFIGSLLCWCHSSARMRSVAAPLATSLEELM